MSDTEWKLVPVEPTTEMKVAGDNAGFWCGDKYRAMLDAAPSPKAPAASAQKGLPACKGMNCGSTDGVSHSLECHAEHAAAIAGGKFAKDASAQKGLNDAARDVIAERQRQVEKEGWTPEHDDGANDVAAMADAAACYAMHAGQVLAQAYSTRCLKPHPLWPWDKRWWKPTTPRRDLVKAGALILAEIERIDRALLRESEGGE